MVVEWVMEVAEVPVLTKLTPNVHPVVPIAKQRWRQGTNGFALINTIQSLMGVDLDTFLPYPDVGGHTAFGGYCGPAVKPIALKMLTTLGMDESNRQHAYFRHRWRYHGRDAVEFMPFGAGNVQVCNGCYEMVSALSMIYVRNVELDGRKGFTSTSDFVGLSIPKVTDWEELDLNFPSWRISIRQMYSLRLVPYYLRRCLTPGYFS